MPDNDTQLNKPLTVFILDYPDVTKRILKRLPNKYNYETFHSISEIYDRIYSNHIPSCLIIDEKYISRDGEKNFINIMIKKFFIPILAIVDSIKSVPDLVSLGINNIIFKVFDIETNLGILKSFLENIELIWMYKKIALQSNDEKELHIISAKEILITSLNILEYIMETKNSQYSLSLKKIGHYTKTFLTCLYFTDNPYQEELVAWNLYHHIIAAQLYDIGKIVLEDSIIYKESKLTEDEYTKIKQHITYGNNIIDLILKNEKLNENIKHIFRIVNKYISFHHENYDGSGYPNKLIGNDIPLEGRIMKIIDSFNALQSHRTYRDGMSVEKSMEMLKINSFKYDLELLDIFISLKDSLICE